MTDEARATHPLAGQHFKDLLLSAVHSIEEAIVVTDFEDRLLFANRAFEVLTGYKTAELMGKVLYREILPEEEWADMESRNTGRRGGETDWYDLEILRKGGQRRQVLGRGMPHLDENGSSIGTVGIMTDMEVLRHLESIRAYLEEEFRAEYEPDSIVGSSPALKKVLGQARQVAPGDTTVLIEGESGTGKELVARTIHDWSKRKQKTLIKVNCAAIPKELFESEFFGHKKGAFTGATADKIGRFELADEGTLFLDEIGELPLEQQGKLLRALQEGEIQRVGETAVRKVSVRLIAATNRILSEEVKQQRFREDLYYRLSVFPLKMPPLRGRREDIPDLANHFVALSCQRLGKKTLRLDASDVERLVKYAWPGNIRELQNVIERSVILSKGRTLQVHLDTSHTEQASVSPDTNREERSSRGKIPGSLRELQDLEKEIVLQALSARGGKIYGENGAAKALGLKPSTLQSRLKKWGIHKIYTATKD